MNYKDEVLKILEDTDVEHAVPIIVNGPAAILRYVIRIGLETMKSKKRRERRRELRADIQPQFKAGRTAGSLVLTKRSKERVIKYARDLFGPDGWNIGDLNIGVFTKEQLLSQAQSERASAKGSIRNAQFYEALAEPLHSGQAVADYWNPAQARQVRDKIWKGTSKQRPDLI